MTMGTPAPRKTPPVFKRPPYLEDAVGLRHRAALSLIQSGEVPSAEDRLSLLAAVVWPTRTLWAGRGATRT